jgi:hypothetical protein
MARSLNVSTRWRSCLVVGTGEFSQRWQSVLGALLSAAGCRVTLMTDC